MDNNTLSKFPLSDSDNDKKASFIALANAVLEIYTEWDNLGGSKNPKDLEISGIKVISESGGSGTEIGGSRKDDAFAYAADNVVLTTPRTTTTDQDIEPDDTLKNDDNESLQF